MVSVSKKSCLWQDMRWRELDLKQPYVNSTHWVLAFWRIKAVYAEKQTLVCTLKHYLDWSTCRAVICKVPFSIRLMRSSLPRILCPSRSHWMLGRGLPITWHCNWAVVPGASVWLAGPWRMMGGIRSDGPRVKRMREAWATRAKFACNHHITHLVQMMLKRSLK